MKLANRVFWQRKDGTGFMNSLNKLGQQDLFADDAFAILDLMDELNSKKKVVGAARQKIVKQFTKKDSKNNPVLVDGNPEITDKEAYGKEIDKLGAVEQTYRFKKPIDLSSKEYKDAGVRILLSADDIGLLKQIIKVK